MKDTIWLVIIALGSCNATNEIGSFIYYSWLWRFSNEMTSTVDDLDAFNNITVILSWL